jgi:hypothetical protein
MYMEKIKLFFLSIWDGLTRAGRIILGLIVIAIIVLLALLIGKNKDKDDDDKKGPEVAQVYEPSIGAPLPPDVKEDGVNVSARVDGASTSEPSTPEPPKTEPAPNYEAPKVAPASGVDLSKPIAYQNSNLKFAATLPAGSNIDEQGDLVTFTSKQGSLLYLVSITNAGSESLQTIASQLRNSPGVSNISYVTFSGNSALQFNSKEYGTGLVFIANGKIYYLFGHSQYFYGFKTI